MRDMNAYDFSLDILFRNCITQPAAREANVDGVQRLTYAQLGARVDRLAHWLLGKGIAPSDRIGVLLTDGSPFLTILLACGRIGAIATLLNWRLAPGEIA